MRIPSPPAGLALLLGLLGDPEVEMNRLAMAVEIDPGLTLTVLRHANSVAFSSGGEVRHVRDALVRLGLRAVRNVVLAHAVANMRRPEDYHGIDLRQFNEDSLRRACAAKVLAELRGGGDRTEAFTVGLLQDVGVLLLASGGRGRDWSGLRRKPLEERLKQERAWGGQDHAEAFSALAEAWSLPRDLGEVIRWHHAPQEAPVSSRSKPLLEVCHAADHLASLVQTEGHPWSLARAEEALTRLFAPRKVSLEQTLERVAQEVREQSEALDVPIEAQPTFEALLSGASKAVLQINSSYEELTQRLEATLREKDALMRELAQKNLQLQRLASTDVLTGLHNRRAFNEEFARQLQLATGELLTLVLLDIDHFKRINDLHGHPCGDEVLGICGKRLQHAVRRADLVYRIGGEEFAVVFPGANMRQGVEASERLRHILVDTPFGCAGGVRIPVTASFGGVTALPTGEQSEELTAAELLRAADHALYRAKQGGRNQVCWHASLLGGPGPVAA